MQSMCRHRAQQQMKVAALGLSCVHWVQPSSQWCNAVPLSISNIDSTTTIRLATTTSRWNSFNFSFFYFFLFFYLRSNNIFDRMRRSSCVQVNETSKTQALVCVLSATVVAVLQRSAPLHQHIESPTTIRLATTHFRWNSFVFSGVLHTSSEAH